MKNYLKLTGVIALTALMSCGGETEEATTENEIEKEPTFVLSGTVATPTNQIYFYQVIDDALELTDSASVADQKFSFSEKTITPQMVYLALDNSRKIPVFVENNEISIDFQGASADSMTVNGSAVQTEWENLQSDLAIYDHQLDSLYEAYYAANESEDETLMEQIGVAYDNVDSTKSVAVEDYISGHPKSYVTPYLITKFMLYSSGLEELMAYKDGLDESISNSVYVETISGRIADLEKTKIGNVMPDFAQADKDGNEIKLSDLRGQYVLIDFWASWCGPCRAENPNVVDAYEKYKDNGFTVLGVSLDDNKENWLKAIEDDKLTWHHVSDLQGWKNAVAQEFGVKSIPFSILIDKEGVILGKNLRGEELQNTLADLFKEV